MFLSDLRRVVLRPVFLVILVILARFVLLLVRVECDRSERAPVDMIAHGPVDRLAVSTPDSFVCADIGKLRHGNGRRVDAGLDIGQVAAEQLGDMELVGVGDQRGPGRPVKSGHRVPVRHLRHSRCPGLLR